jgi:hypothetical protein
MSSHPQPAAGAAMGHLGRRYLLWQQTVVKGRQTKVPLQTNGKKARTNDVSTWCRLDQATDALDRMAVDGVGIVLGKLGEHRWLVGVDLDLCRSPVTGKIEEWAQRRVDRFATYTEVSPSGTGLKLYGYVDQPPACMWDGEKFAGKEITPPSWAMPEGAEGCGHEKAEIGVYAELRYFAL